MESTTLFFIIAIGYLVNTWILSEVIKGATKSQRNILLQEAQVKLLASIALKSGVPIEDVLKDTKGIELN